MGKLNFKNWEKYDMETLDGSGDIDFGSIDKWWWISNMLRDNYHLPDVTQWQNIVMLITLFGLALFLDSETLEILELLKSFDTKKTIHFYRYLLSINKWYGNAKKWMD